MKPLRGEPRDSLTEVPGSGPLRTIPSNVERHFRVHVDGDVGEEGEGGKGRGGGGEKGKEGGGNERTGGQ